MRFLAITVLSFLMLAACTMEPDGEFGTREQRMLDEDSVWWEHVGSSGTNWEAEFVLPDNCLLTGIGATVKNNNVTYVRWRCRELRADGRLGMSRTGYVGSGNNIEQWLEVPYGQFITGVGFNVYRDNVNRINLWRASWNRSTLRLTTLPGCLSTDGNCNNNEVVIDQSAQGIDLSRVGIVGLKLNAYRSDMNRMQVGYAVICADPEEQDCSN